MQKELGENLFFPRNHRGGIYAPPTWNKLYQSPRGIGLNLGYCSEGGGGHECHEGGQGGALALPGI